MTNHRPHEPWTYRYPRTEFALGLITLIAMIGVLVYLVMTKVTMPLLVPAAGWAFAGAYAWDAWKRERNQRRADDDLYERARALDEALNGTADRLIGDRERDAVCQALADAVEAGRLTLPELDDRQSAALAARTPGDLRATLRGLL